MRQAGPRRRETRPFLGPTRPPPPPRPPNRPALASLATACPGPAACSFPAPPLPEEICADRPHEQRAVCEAGRWQEPPQVTGVAGPPPPVPRTRTLPDAVPLTHPHPPRSPGMGTAAKGSSARQPPSSPSARPVLPLGNRVRCRAAAGTLQAQGAAGVWREANVPWLLPRPVLRAGSLRGSAPWGSEDGLRAASAAATNHRRLGCCAGPGPPAGQRRAVLTQVGPSPAAAWTPGPSARPLPPRAAGFTGRGGTRRRREKRARAGEGRRGRHRARDHRRVCAVRERERGAALRFASPGRPRER